jgi:hypothetical protein
MIKKLSYILLGVLFIYACGNKGGSSSSEGDFGAVPEDVINEGVLVISQEEMEGFVENMSSPVEMAALIKGLDVEFSSKYLAPTDNVENFSTSFSQAFNLGVYGVDLGYLNIYNKTQSVIDYISAIKTLSDGIDVGQFFDFTTLKRLAQNNQNLDSLMFISVQSFNRMDRYLRQNNRSNLSVLIVTGLWVEGMYLATQVYKEAPHPELKERIGEQKLILDKLVLFLQNFKGDKQFDSLIADLELIRDDLKDVKITVKKGEPEAIEQDGMLVIVQNDISIIEITDEQVQKIIDDTEKIRNKLISL